MCINRDESEEVALNDMIRLELEEKMNEVLGQALDGSSGDTAPEQVIEWENLRNKMAALMTAIVVQNKPYKGELE